MISLEDPRRRNSRWAKCERSLFPPPCGKGARMSEPTIVSVNVGRSRTVVWQGRPVKTGIYKEPVAGRVRVGATGLSGDGQADLRVHGGPLKAVYAYPSEHYASWARELSRGDLSWGAFGENLTTAGLLESEVRIGDRLEVGSALLEVTQPRFPCFKLGNKFGSMGFVKQFAASGRSGFYLAVVQEGEVGTGDAIRAAKRAAGRPTIARAFAEALGGEDEG
jgi:MOSC domain-containing protein YiiM